MDLRQFNDVTRQLLAQRIRFQVHNISDVNCIVTIEGSLTVEQVRTVADLGATMMAGGTFNLLVAISESNG